MIELLHMVSVFTGEGWVDAMVSFRRNLETGETSTEATVDESMLDFQEQAS